MPTRPRFKLCNLLHFNFNKLFATAMKEKDYMNNNAIIYVRVSSTGDRQDTTRQVEDLTRYAASNGLDAVATYEENASGAKRDREQGDRDCFQQKRSAIHPCSARPSQNRFIPYCINLRAEINPYLLLTIREIVLYLYSV